MHERYHAQEGSVCKFVNHRNTVCVPVVAYSEFETMHMGLVEKRSRRRKPKTVLMNEHILMCFSITFVSDIPGFQPKPISYVGLDAGKRYVEALETVRDVFYQRYSESVKMKFGEEEERLHEAQSVCYVCKYGFCDNHEKGQKVRDHDHFTGKYRGALRSVCNTKLKRSWDIPVFFHNLSSFDSHLFVKELCDNGNTDVHAIPENEEKYISFCKDKYFSVLGKDGKRFNRRLSLRFIDSLRHMPSFLSNLVKDLPREKFHNMRKKFTPDQLDLLLRKVFTLTSTWIALRSWKRKVYHPLKSLVPS